MLLGIVVSGTVVVVCCFVRLVDHNAESAASVDAVVNVAGAIGYGITAISARYLSAEQITFAGGGNLAVVFRDTRSPVWNYVWNRRSAGSLRRLNIPGRVVYVSAWKRSPGNVGLDVQRRTGSILSCPRVQSVTE